jgi:hypothetical protein
MAAFAATLAIGDNLGLELEPEEARELALALAHVEEYYPIPVPEEKHRALISLALVAGRIYGKRAAPLFGFTPRQSGSEPAAPASPVPAPALNGAGAGASALDDVTRTSWFPPLDA